MPTFASLLTLPLAQCSARCDISLVHTQIMVTLNIASKWAMGTERDGWVMPTVCMGKTLFRGIILGEIWA